MIGALSLSLLAKYLPESLAPQLLHGDADFDSVSTDTRTAKSGDLFVALRGERYDAHKFLEQALERGVGGLVLEEARPDLKLPQLIVHDSLTALGQIGALNRDLFTGPLVAITGSSGKTSVKTMLAGILSEAGDTLATRGNLNNHIGVPITLMALETRHQYAVIEMGASGVGEIAYLCRLARPDIALINNVMPAHIEGFGSIEGVAKAKGEIYAGLSPEGTAVINLDDHYAPRWRSQMVGRKMIGFSLFEPSADCRAENVHYGVDNISFTLITPEGDIALKLNAAGEHNLRNALAATGCALAAGASLEQIAVGLRKFAPVAGRMSQQRGWRNALIIDDSYNANPGSVRAAISVLANHEPERVLVLGDMGELGEEGPTQHREIGAFAQASGIDRLLTLGPLSALAAESFGAGAQSFEDRDSLVEKLKERLSEKSTVLIKGSRSARMDLVVASLLDSGEQN